MSVQVVYGAFGTWRCKHFNTTYVRLCVCRNIHMYIHEYIINEKHAKTKCNIVEIER